MRGKEKTKNGVASHKKVTTLWRKPLAKSDKIDLTGSLELYWKRDIQDTLKLSFAEYLKVLEGLFEGSAYWREAWVCRTFRQRKFSQLFTKPDLPRSTKQGREQCRDYGELLDHIYLATSALLKFRGNLKSEIEPRQRAKLSRSEIELVRRRFKELTQQKNPRCSKNYAYEIIAEEFKVSKSGIRRACDSKFAEQSHCRYDTVPQNKACQFSDFPTVVD
jgi:hypothetical protein